MSETANGPTLVQTDDPNEYYKALEVVDALNVVLLLLTPFRDDWELEVIARNDEDPGLRPHGLTPEGWRMLPAIVRAMDDVLEAHRDLRKGIHPVFVCLLPLRWAIHALVEVNRESTPDFTVPENAATILDQAYEQVRELRDVVRQEVNNTLRPEGFEEPGLPA